MARKPAPLKLDQMRTISQLGFEKAVVSKASPRVAELTVRDLNDLAAAFQGVEVRNPRISKLSVQDIQNIEEVFGEYKMRQLQKISTTVSRVDELAIDISCCCCTPCCCCAATEVDPFAV